MVALKRKDAVGASDAKKNVHLSPFNSVSLLQLTSLMSFARFAWVLRNLPSTHKALAPGEPHRGKQNKLMDQDYYNEVYEEEAHQQFDEALSTRDFNTARLVLADLEDKKFETYEMRRRLNLAMVAPTVTASYKSTDSESIDRHISGSSEGYGGSY